MQQPLHSNTIAGILNFFKGNYIAKGRR